MPIYDWTCTNGHTHEGFSSAEKRDEPRTCKTCGESASRQFPHPHVPPSGVYSYEPNIGDPEVFERRREHIRQHGNKAIPKILSRKQEQRLRDEGRIP